MKHRYRTRHVYGHVDTCNIQNIERSTGVVSLSNTDRDACRIPNTTKNCGVRTSYYFSRGSWDAIPNHINERLQQANPLQRVPNIILLNVIIRLFKIYLDWIPSWAMIMLSLIVFMTRNYRRIYDLPESLCHNLSDSENLIWNVKQT